MKTGTWQSGSSESRRPVETRWQGKGEDGNWDSKMHFCHLKGYG